MRQLIIDKIVEGWTDTSPIEYNIELDAVYDLVDSELFELFEQILTNSLITQNERYKEELRRLYGLERPFICGWAGAKQSDGLNDYVLVGRSYGDEKFVMYKRFKDL